MLIITICTVLLGGLFLLALAKILIVSYIKRKAVKTLMSFGIRIANKGGKK